MQCRCRSADLKLAVEYKGKPGAKYKTHFIFCEKCNKVGPDSFSEESAWHSWLKKRSAENKFMKDKLEEL